MATAHARKLPHIHAVGQPTFITWNLHGSIPAGRVFPEGATAGQAFVAMDQLLDNARSGPLYLKMPEIAGIIVEALQYREHVLKNFDLHAWVIMANHVHILITPHVGVSAIMRSLKRHTAREANRILGLTGQPFWNVESYDHLVRSGQEFKRIAAYIEMNPVKAGVAAAPEDYPWSSAYVRQAGSLRRVANPPF